MKTYLPMLVVAALAAPAIAPAAGIAPAPNGIAMPEGWRDWRVISVSHRVDNETLRVILGNDDAIRAARAGETDPWPDGATLAKVVWKQGTNENWEPAVEPASFVHVEFMIKDAARFADTLGWGYARWKGADLAAHGEDAGFAGECVACHMPVADRDYVFTTPAPLALGH